jgi:hypothetical protein
MKRYSVVAIFALLLVTLFSVPSYAEFQPTDDARVSFGFPTSNYGSSDVLRVRGASSNDYEGYLKFTISDLAGAPTSVILRLFVTDSSPDGGDVYVVADTSWNEATITASNAPGISGAPIASAGSVTAGTWIELNLPPSAIPGDGTYSFGMKSTSSNSAFYSSKEGANPPALLIERGSRGCLVKMVDNANEGNFLPYIVFLESRSERLEGGEVRYIITSDFASQEPWQEEIIVPKNSNEPIMTDAGVPLISISEIRKRYLFGGLLNLDGASLLKNGYAAQDGQLTWVIESELSSCSKDDLALIVFMVFEWFFFG